MIFPGDFNELTRPPRLTLSWMVLLLNVFFYIVITLIYDPWPTYSARKTLTDEKFLNSVYEMYIQTLDPIEKKDLDKSYNQSDSMSSRVSAISFQALKNQKFWNRVNDFPFIGDQVQISASRKIISDFYQSYLNSPQHHFGLGTLEVSPWSWMTYQFVHISFLHLLGNLVLGFLLISYLEKSVHSLWIGATYLFSGFAGGVAFLFFDSINSGSGMSVIGASASASGLLGFLLITRGNQLMPWGFFIAPVKSGFGKIYLPVFFIFPLFLVSDFLNLLWTPSGIVSNVAVSAHVGGFLMGLIMGTYYLLLFKFLGSKTTSHGVFSYNDGFHKLP